jgi:putative transport protein
MNFGVLGGLLARSMTDPPTLMFATSLATSEAPAVAYLTFYPLTTLLRILAAQVCSPPFADGGRA